MLNKILSRKKTLSADNAKEILKFVKSFRKENGFRNIKKVNKTKLKTADISDIFHSLKFAESAQKIKDRCGEGWN